MLSQHERRALADIEEHLAADQPDLARLLEGFDRWAPPRHRVRRRGPLATLGLGIVLLAVAFAVHSAAVMLLAAGTLASVGLMLITRAIKAIGPHRVRHANGSADHTER